MCKVLEVSSSGYYDWLSRSKSEGLHWSPAINMDTSAIRPTGEQAENDVPSNEQGESPSIEYRREIISSKLDQMFSSTARTPNHEGTTEKEDSIKYE